MLHSGEPLSFINILMNKPWNQGDKEQVMMLAIYSKNFIKMSSLGQRKRKSGLIRPLKRCLVCLDRFI